MTARVYRAEFECTTARDYLTEVVRVQVRVWIAEFDSNTARERRRNVDFRSPTVGGARNLRAGSAGASPLSGAIRNLPARRGAFRPQ